MQAEQVKRLLAAVPWREGDTLRVKSSGKIGVAVYRYYNGFTLMAIPGEDETTYANGELQSCD